MKRLLSALAAVAIALSLLTGPPLEARTLSTDFSQTLSTSAKTSDSLQTAVGETGFSVVVSGTFSANWRLQASVDNGATWVDYVVIDRPTLVAVPNLPPMQWRVSAAGGGDFTSGTATVSFLKGGRGASHERLLNGDGKAVTSTNPLDVKIAAGAAAMGSVTLGAGSNIAGKFGIDQTTPGTTNGVQVTAAIPVGANHIGQVGGEAAVVSATLTKSTKTTAYSSGQLITQGNAGASSAIAVAVARANDKTGMVRAARLKVNDATWLNATVRVHLFRDSPTFTNGDAGNFAAGLTESTYVCKIDVVLDLSFSDPAVKGRGVPTEGSECNFVPSSGTQNVYAVFEARSTTAGSHTASSTFTLALEALQN